MNHQSFDACILPLSESLSGADRSSKASYLASALHCLHSLLDVSCREAPYAVLSAPNAEVTNVVFAEVRQLLGDYAGVQRFGDAAHGLHIGDALTLIGQYREALRRYRVEQLGENESKIAS
jgi:hypothetical protein